MKKLIAVLLLALFTFVFFACGDKETVGNGSDKEQENVEQDGNKDGSANTENTGKKETVKISFDLNGQGATVNGNVQVEIEKGTALQGDSMPRVSRDGYDFDGWAYDTNGDSAWNEGDCFYVDTVLYAAWIPTQSGGSSGNNGGNTDSGSTDNIITDGVTVEFNTGTGYFTDTSLYETVIKKGGRLGSLPTPVHDNVAMLFEGWYKDEACTIPVSLSDKYSENAMLYAHWVEQTMCSDGTFNHFYSSGWDVDQKATCDKAGTYARYCEYCNDKQVKNGDPALGHQYGQWEETFMARERKCQRLGCGESEIVNFENLTVSLLGNRPASQIVGTTDKFYSAAPFTNLINGRWDEGYGEHVSPNGKGSVYIQFNLVTPTALDRIYFKATGSVSVTIYVQYEGDTDWSIVGICGSSSEKENAPFVTVDGTKNIASIKFVEESPQNGAAIWQEVAFVRVVEE